MLCDLMRKKDGGSLIQLAYRSTSVSGVDSALEMSDILAQARPLNAQRSISGVLTAIDGTFVQIVEGPADSVDLLMAALARDGRHTALRVIERRRVKQRAFADWDMVSPRLVGLEITQLKLLLTDDGFGLDDLIPLLARAIARQDAVLQGLERPLRGLATPPVSHPGIAQGTEGEA